MIALLQAVCGFYGASARRLVYVQVAERGALLQFTAVAVSFACLMSRFIASDFSVALVAQGSRYDLPLMYRMTALWGNHEGSMLLWVTILALFGAGFVISSGKLAPLLRVRVVAVMGLIGVGFYGFILFTSDPFARLSPAPIEGQGLNPILMDPGLAFHPPLLYLGYVGFAVAFAFAVAGLLAGEIDAAWSRWLRPWVLTAWIFLTLGICLGSWWAYYTLGWGGWWFWDPVENAALMPWLLGTALLHSVLVVERREALKRWTLLLAILTFGLSLIGTFLVRSGVLTSVHAFASDPERGVYILLLVVVLLGGALLLYALRVPRLSHGGIFAPISRESALVVNNIALCSAAVAVFVGTLYPIVLGIIGAAPVTVGPPYFMITFLPMVTPLLVAVAIGPMLAWKQADLWAAMQRLGVAALGLLLVLGCVYGVVAHVPALAWFGVGFATWIALGTLTEWSERVGLFHLPLQVVMRRMRFLPMSAWGKSLAHMGLAVSILGMAGSAFRDEAIQVMYPQQSLTLGHLSLQMNQITRADKGGYLADRAEFSVWRKGKNINSLVAERRIFGEKSDSSEGQVTQVTAIASHGFYNLYVALGNLAPPNSGSGSGSSSSSGSGSSSNSNSNSNDTAGKFLKKGNMSAEKPNSAANPPLPPPSLAAPPPATGFVVRVYLTPLESFIWFGAVMMALGGGLALLDRTSHQRQLRLWTKMGLDGGERRTF